MKTTDLPQVTGKQVFSERDYAYHMVYHISRYLYAIYIPINEHDKKVSFGSVLQNLCFCLL